MILSILYWVFLVLALVVGLVPDSQYTRYGRVGFSAILFVIIGLRLFAVALK